MGQAESHLGTATGILLLRDRDAATPDQSGLTWLANPGWKPLHGLRCVGMTEEEAARWEAESNPWGEAAAAEDALAAVAQQLALDPTVQAANDASKPLAERLRAFDELHARRNAAASAVASRAGGGNAIQHGGRAGRPATERDGGSRVVRMAHGVLYVGDVGAKGRPHGGGKLVLRDGSVHLGLFENGAANGEGVYFDKAGSVHTGSWAANRRVGNFEVLDPGGTFWDDVYDAQGKRTSRRSASEAGAAGSKAVPCRHCGVRYHQSHNFACRRHRSGWDAQQWPCCGARARDEPGCHLESAHEGEE